MDILAALGFVRMAYHKAIVEDVEGCCRADVAAYGAALDLAVGETNSTRQDNIQLRNEVAALKGQIVALNHAARRPAAHIVPSP